MASRKLDKSEWQAFCDHLSKALLGNDSDAANASLTVGEEVAAEWVPLLGVAFDPRSDSFDIALGGLEHRVRKPRDFVRRRGVKRSSGPRGHRRWGRSAWAEI